MTFVHRIRNWRNPHNLTSVHLAGLVRRYGYAVGDHSYGRPKIRFPQRDRPLAIGRFCSIADKVEILLGGNHRTDWVSTFPFAAFPDRWPDRGDETGAYHSSRGGVTIGSDVWLGSGATVLSGVTVGHGAVIAARAVVSRDVPPYAVVAGNPARVVRMRFPAETVRALIETAWWDLPDGEVARLVPILSGLRTDELIAAVRDLRARSSRSSAGPGAEP